MCKQLNLKEPGYDASLKVGIDYKYQNIQGIHISFLTSLSARSQIYIAHNHEITSQLYNIILLTVEGITTIVPEVLRS